MIKISDYLYQIEENEPLLKEAEEILKKPIPAHYKDKYDLYRETSNICDRIIKDKSDQIDIVVSKIIKGSSGHLSSGLICKFIENQKTERVIDELFEKAKSIYKIESETSPKEIVVKVNRHI